MTVRDELLAAQAAIASALAQLPPDPTPPPVPTPAPPPPTTGVRLVMWAKATDIAAMTDAQLDGFKAKGIGGFVLKVGDVVGLGGDQDFTTGAVSATAANY